MSLSDWLLLYSTDWRRAGRVQVIIVRGQLVALRAATLH